MKAILSRKGMDSKAGGLPSPILPDGTLLSLPIPDDKSGQRYGDLYYKGHNLLEIICQLNPHFDTKANSTCHLDPDIYDELIVSDKDRKPAYGQWGGSASHLDTYGVAVGDIFLFYGIFRQTELQNDNRLVFVKGSPVLHIIYGYMEIGEILREQQEMQHRYPWHPHSQCDYTGNRLYLPKRYGTFRYNETLILTDTEQKSRSIWKLPSFFANEGISISWQGNRHPVKKNGHAELQSTPRGQEFVITTTTAEQSRNLSDWVETLIHNGTNKTGGVIKSKSGER